MINFIGTKQTSKNHLSICFIFCIFGFSGCGNSDSDNQTPGNLAMQEINLSIIHEGSNGETTGFKQFTTLSDQQGYETKLMEFSSDSSPFTIDFTSQRVLLVSMGEQTSGGYSIEVTSIEEFSDGLVATVVLSSPGVNCIVTDALTHPYKFIQVSSLDDDIQVSEQNVVVDCA